MNIVRTWRCAAIGCSESAFFPEARACAAVQFLLEQDARNVWALNWARAFERAEACERLIAAAMPGITLAGLLRASRESTRRDQKLELFAPSRLDAQARIFCLHLASPERSGREFERMPAYEVTATISRFLRTFGLELALTKGRPLQLMLRQTGEHIRGAAAQLDKLLACIRAGQRPKLEPQTIAELAEDVRAHFLRLDSAETERAIAHMRRGASPAVHRPRPKIP